MSDALFWSLLINIGILWLMALVTRNHAWETDLRVTKLEAAVEALTKGAE